MQYYYRSVRDNYYITQYFPVSYFAITNDFTLRCNNFMNALIVLKNSVKHNISVANKDAIQKKW